MMFDVIIVGGATAGLSAALVLGRCGRQVLVCDSGEPRNRFTNSMHGFISRDGIAPLEFLKIAREQLAPYSTVSLRGARITKVEKLESSFRAIAEDGSEFFCRKVLLCMGVRDEVPAIPGVKECYGSSVHHCPYCDGWEYFHQPIAALGSGQKGAGLAKELLGWSSDVILCTNGPSKLEEIERERLRTLRVAVIETPIRKIDERNGKMRGIEFMDGEYKEREALFFISTQSQHCDIAGQLGCNVCEGGFVDCGEDGVITNTPGVYAAGNTTTGLQMAIVAAAEGAKAAWEINQALIAEMIQSSTGDPRAF